MDAQLLAAFVLVPMRLDLAGVVPDVRHLSDLNFETVADGQCRLCLGQVGLFRILSFMLESERFAPFGVLLGYTQAEQQSEYFAAIAGNATCVPPKMHC